MKIGFFYPEYYPVRASASVHGYYLARGLVDRGHKLLSCIGDENPNCILYPQSKPGMIKLILDADVLYVRIMSYFEHVCTWRMLRLFNLPVVWEIDAPLEEQYAFYEDKQAAKKELAWQNLKRQFFARFVDAGICVSDQMADYSKKFLKIKNSYTIPNGSNAQFFKKSKNKFKPQGWEGKFVIVWAGNPTLPWQAMQLMFNVAQKIQKIDKDIMFVFISSELEYKFPEEDNIAVLTRINYLSLPNYLPFADICLCLYNSYDWCPWGFYNSPLKLFDYMAAGVAVIASNMGQIAQVIKDNKNGLLTDNQEDDIIKKIIKLKEDRTLSKRIGKAAEKNIIEYYNWDRVAKETEEVLQSVVKIKY
ncbi:MAG: glycosyltransferase [Candidatus Omnitrophota bacterium]